MWARIHHASRYGGVLACYSAVLPSTAHTVYTCERQCTRMVGQCVEEWESERGVGEGRVPLLCVCLSSSSCCVWPLWAGHDAIPFLAAAILTVPPLRSSDVGRAPAVSQRGEEIGQRCRERVSEGWWGGRRCRAQAVRHLSCECDHRHDVVSWQGWVHHVVGARLERHPCYTARTR